MEYKEPFGSKTEDNKLQVLQELRVSLLLRENKKTQRSKVKEYQSRGKFYIPEKEDLKSLKLFG